MASRADTLPRFERDGITLNGYMGERLSFAFTERTGGVSEPPYQSLNLGSHVGDDPFAVEENRRRVLEALGCTDCAHNLLVPNQVHGDEIVCVNDAGADALEEVRERIALGCDGIVCTVPDVPVMLCFADCVPVVLTAPGGFAVVHSGWKGTYACISGKAATALADAAGCETSQIKAYLGPHILGDEYEVLTDLLQKFQERFDTITPSGSRMLDLSRAIRQSLEEVGVPPCEIHDPGLSTVRLGDRFYSYRREAGTCGRHAAIAVMR